MGQAWLDERFVGLVPADFGVNVQFFTTASLKPPWGFEDKWLDISTDHTPILHLDRERLSQILALVVIGNPAVERELVIMSDFLEAVELVCEHAAPVLWLHHTDAQINVDSDVALQFLELGLHSVIGSKRSGFELCLDVRANISQSDSQAYMLAEMENDKQARGRYAEHLQECIDAILWDYFRARFCPCIPPLRTDIPAGLPAQLDSATRGRRLGSGMFGSVHMLEPPQGVTTTGLGEVVKLIVKRSVKDFQDLSSLKRAIDIMHMFSSEQWQHPNIVKLYEVYHTPTHICLRIECAGDSNLFVRLQRRDRIDGRRQPMPYKFVVQLTKQLVSVIAHMHLGPQVCHRDIKPENCIIHEDEHRIQLKLVDFDMAMVHKETSMCRSPCGTLPFTAPEVMLESPYSGKSADMWSLGIVLFEILCGTRIIEQVLALSNEELRGADQDQPNRPNTAVAQKIRDFFRQYGSASEILEMYILPDLRRLAQFMSPLIDDLLNVSASERLRADALVERIKNLESEGE